MPSPTPDPAVTLAALTEALEKLRINLVVGACEGPCLCSDDEWISWHNSVIDAALRASREAPEGPEEELLK